MVRKILLGVVVSIVVILFLIWLASGGIGRTKATFAAFPKTIGGYLGILSGSTTRAFYLPGQPPAPQVPFYGDASSSYNGYDGTYDPDSASSTEAHARLLELQAKYQELQLEQQAQQSGAYEK